MPPAGRSDQHTLKQWAFWSPLATLLLIELVRARLVDRFYSQVTTAHGAFGAMVIKHDTLIIGIVVLTHLFGWSVSSRPLSRALRLIAWSALLLCLVDLFAFALFNKRLSVEEVILFGDEGHAIFRIVDGFVRDQKNLPVTLAMTFTILSLVAAWPAHSPLSFRHTSVGFIAGIVMIGVFFWPERTTYVADWAYRNFIEIEEMSGVLKSYSPAAIEAAHRWSEIHDQGPERRCVPGLNTRRDVILVLMESLSSHHSRYISGLSDWVPHIDAIARQNHVWTNFYANGNNTSFGLVATLTGHDPLTAINAREYGRFLNTAEALPYRLKQYGYESAFLTSGDLEFLHAGKWLTSIGFDRIEGADARFYDGMERFAFKAARDGALYDRALQWTQGRSAPFFLALLTVSTHQPYMNPVTHERSEKAAFGYADAALDEFVRSLFGQGYFARGGVLLLLGDHRDMVVLGRDELRRYNDSADARIPLVILGDGLAIPQQVVGPFQQADIPPSIEFLAGDRACFAGRQRNLFLADQQESPRCILHMRGDQYDVVDAFCGGYFGRIRLDGDATAVVQGEIPDSKALIQEVNAERIGWFLRRQSDGSVVRKLPEGVQISLH